VLWYLYIASSPMLDLLLPKAQADHYHACYSQTGSRKLKYEGKSDKVGSQ